MKVQVTHLLWAIALFTIGFNADSIAQSTPIVFNKQSGLPSEMIYDVKVSTDQKIWLTTDKGVSCYDGSSFINYNLTDGLPTSFSWRLYEDSHDRMWLHNNETPFTYIKNGQVKRVGKKYEKFYINTVLEDSKGVVYINSLKSKQCFVIDTLDQLIIKSDSLYFGEQDGQPRWLSWEKAKNNFETVYAFYFFKNWMIYETKKNPRDLGRGVVAYNFETEEKIDLNELSNYKYSFHTISEMKDGRFFIVHDKGAIALKARDGKLVLLPMASTEGKGSGFAVDINENKWMSTHGNGLLYFGRLDQDVSFTGASTESNNIIGAFKTPDGKLALNDNNEFLLLYEAALLKEKIAIPFAKTGMQIQYFKDYLLVFNGTMLYVLPSLLDLKDISRALEACMEIPRERNEINFYQCIYQGHTKTVSLLTDEVLFGTNANGISLIADKDALKIKLLYDGYVYAINRKDDGTYLVGNHDGLYEIRNQEKKLIWNQEGVNGIINLNGKYFMKSYASNLFEIKEAGLTRIREIENKYSHAFSSSNHLAMLSSEELNIYNTSEWSVNFSANVYNGFASGDFVYLLEDGEQLRLITENGFYTIPKNSKNRNERDEIFRIENVKINDVTISAETINLSNEYSNLDITLFANDYPRNTRLKYSYRLQPGDDNWSQFKSADFQISRIPFDTKSLELRAMKTDGSQFGERIILNIKNPAPFHKKKYFGLLLALASFLLASIAFYFIQRFRLKRMEEHFDTIENKHKMLSLQMKPHFLSNVFNTLQSSVLLDDVQDTSRFIKEVDDYLRETLKNSQIQFQSLAQEIELAKKYAAIEQRRYKNEIKVEIDPNCYSQTVNLPVFTLQPLVENAIWHGLRKANREKGLIKINLETSNEYFIISIFDNGNGLQEHDQTGNNIALKNIEKRLSLIDQNKRENYIEFEEPDEGLIVNIYAPRDIKNINSRRRA